MKRIVILGSSGSIGQNALRVAEALKSEIRVVGLAVDRNTDEVARQAAQFGVKHVAVADMAAAECGRRILPAGTELYKGPEGLVRLAAMDGVDLVLCAVVGMAGLAPVLSALGKGRDVALATKEALVVAGKIVINAARQNNCRILPVDSEHSAVFQCIEGHGRDARRIVLTASGGPFRNKPNIDFDKVTVKETLDHPSWRMGKKVTVDSATLMNKGLEIMEAQWLFNMPLDKIDVVIHPESIIHSIVEFADGGMLSQMSVPDMRFAIQYAMTWPRRMDGGLPALDLVKAGAFHFSAPDENRFPCLALARSAARTGGTMPAALNAANEIAVRKFLDGHMPFSGIPKMVDKIMSVHKTVADPSLDDIVAADEWARRTAGEMA